MPSKSRGPQQVVAEKRKIALLLVDVIRFSPETPLFLRVTRRDDAKAQALEGVRGRGVATIYVKDNFGRWHSNFRVQVKLLSGDLSRTLDHFVPTARQRLNEQRCGWSMFPPLWI